LSYPSICKSPQTIKAMTVGIVKSIKCLNILTCASINLILVCVPPVSCLEILR
jgi:hypothetical protein